MPSLRKRRSLEKAAMALEDPVQFTESMLNHRIWSRQQEILRSVATFPRTAVKACHASGKTFIAAAAVLWWITTHREAIAVTTAPTWTQVERILWSEIRRMVSCARINYPKPATTSLHLDANRYAIGLATNEGVRFQGFHGNVLIVLDEAPGVLPEIYEAIEGIRAGGDVRVLALGNPLISSGPFFDAFSSNREGWNLITISAFDTPNLEGLTLEDLLRLPEADLDQNPCPYLTTRRWVKEKYTEWGTGHPLWEARVLGNFPTQSDDALISLTWLEQAKLRTEGDGDIVAGLDVAGPGECETVLCVRQGPRIIHLRGWTSDDARGDVLAALLSFKSRLKRVQVDTVGIGHYLAKHLKDHGLPVTPVNVGEAPRDRERFANRKAEIYWQFRERASSGDLAGLTDDRTIAQLAGIRYSHNSRGQIVIESKEEARKRGVKSPDRAEAVILAFADLGATLGLIEFYRRELEESKARRGNGASLAPAICRNCGGAVSQFGEFYRCNACGGTGVCERPSCPRCQSPASRTPSGWRCMRCGFEFGETTPRPVLPTRSNLDRWP